MDVTITATLGRPTGSRPSRRLRSEGKVPAVLYGLGKDDVSLTVEFRSLRQALTTDAGLNAVITLDVDGTEEICLVRELQRHPVRNDVIHVDFVRVDVDAEVMVEVPILLEGEARSVLSENGVVDQILYALTVFAKPTAIPNELAIDITELEVGDVITVADVKLPAGVRTEMDPEEAVVTASQTRVEEEPEAEEDGEEAAAAAESSDDEE